MNPGSEPSDATPSLIDYAERGRTGDWTLRSALVRYAQPEPARAGAVLELVRRTDAALKPFHSLVQQSPDLEEIARAGDGVERDRRLDDDEAMAVALLAVAAELDQMSDVLVEWAADIDRPRPDTAVDEIARRVFTRLADLGVERETRPPRRG